MKGRKTLASVFGEFCTKMRTELPETRIFDDYFSAVEGFDIDLVEQALKEWSMDNAFRFPSPNELNEALVGLSAREDRKGQPKTIRDLFGNRVRTETPLARDLRNILRSLTRDRINRDEAQELVLEAEKRHGFVNEPVIPRRKSPYQCIYDAGIDENAVRKACMKRHKREDDRKAMSDLAACLLPYGHFFLRAGRKGLEFLSMEDGAWRESFQVLADYAR